ncbi:COX15/CtaA family protein [Phycicoccus sonneratiae]|uniref:COX15/CtaA family protein n=1 Tax=Phycicoccus sonneratiae TaxID=2807628 RepID=A0ABS2CI55_9MICO|nr:COX15/CtaA family protein [Phycicoccus sonneraticus]MBM6399544.1 COX15/CtaA family protein [Phycicoccus sonneraticus]
MTTRTATPVGTGTRAGSRWLGPVLLADLVAQVGIVVTGGLVRLTGSGLGCPTWPRCTGASITPTVEQAEGFHKYIEFGNRTLTGVLAVLAVASVVVVWRFAPRRAMKVASAVVLGGVVAQALLGGLTVLLGLHPATVAAHFLLSMVLVVAAAYLWFARGEATVPARPLVPDLVVRLAWVTSGVGAVVLALGTVVTGSGPHSGDADTPNRFGFDPRTISWLHADVVMLFLGLVVATWLAARLTAEATSAPRAWLVVLGVSLAQGLVGYVQYLTALPEALVLAHMFGAAMLVVALTAGVLALRSRTT